MSYSSRRAYTGISDSNCATYDDDCQDLSHRPLQDRVFEQRRRVTVTRYRIDTADNFTTSYYDRREYTAHETHQSSFGNHTPLKGHRDTARLPRGNSRLPEASFERNHAYTHRPKQELRKLGERRGDRHSKSDRRYSSDHDIVHEKRSSRGAQPSADKGQGYTNFAYAKSSQQKEHKPACESGCSGVPRTHSSNKSPRSDHYNHEKPNSSRRNDTPQGNSRSNRNNTAHKPEPQARDDLPDFYAILKISHLATDGQIRSAAKRRRVEVHPDQNKKAGMSKSEMDEIDAVAATIGEASEVLLDPEQKLKYDRKLYAAKGWK